MECNRAMSLIDAYLDGELDPVHAVEVESHLQECGGVGGALEGRRKLAAGRAADEVAVFSKRRRR